MPRVHLFKNKKTKNSPNKPYYWHKPEVWPERGQKPQTHVGPSDGISSLRCLGETKTFCCEIYHSVYWIRASCCSTKYCVYYIQLFPRPHAEPEADVGQFDRLSAASVTDKHRQTDSEKRQSGCSTATTFTTDTAVYQYMHTRESYSHLWLMS